MQKPPAVPRHVAFIMDGNGRWAEQRGLKRLDGHRAGVQNIRPLVKSLKQRGVDFVTLYAFSTENWNRPEEEISGIFRLLDDIIESEARELHKNGVRITHIGRLEGLSHRLQTKIKAALKLTRNNRDMTLVLALNYGGRAEILDAVRRSVAAGVSPASLDEQGFARYLDTAGLPDVDLMVRTGGELRISNFLIWQSAYAEYYFTPVLWPDFAEAELSIALDEYSRRQRRFGGLGEKE